MDKIQLRELSAEDLHLINEATSHYSRILQQLCFSENRMQQHIHLSILEVFRYDLVKRLLKREQPKNSTIKMEVHTAFVLYDALDIYESQVTSLLSSAIIGRMKMELFPLLPSARDHQKLSLESKMHLIDNA